MQVACSRCGARYKIPSEKLEAGPVKVRCKECDHVFGVRKKVSMDDFDILAAPAAAAAVPNEQPPHSAQGEAPEGEATQSATSRTDDLSQGAAQSLPPLEEQSEELLPDAGFGDDDFNFDDLDMGIPGEAAPKGAADELPEKQTDELAVDDFGSDSPDLSGGFPGGAEGTISSAPDPAPAPVAEETEEQTALDSLEFDLSDFDSSVFDSDDTDARLSVESKGVEADIEDLFDDEAEVEIEAPSAQTGESPDGFAVGLRELEFSVFDSGADFEAFSGDESPTEELEKVEFEDLITQPPADRSVPGEQVSPRLDLRKGERRTEALAVPVEVPATKKRTSVVWALLVSVLMGTAALVGYNALIQPDAAFHLLKPGSLLQWLDRAMGDRTLKLTEPVEGAYLNRPGKASLYVISGWVTNTSSDTKSAVEVKGSIFGPDGAKVGEATSLCGNVIPQEELLVLQGKELVERLAMSGGGANASLAVKPGAKAPFMVVFSSPPPGVAKFTVEVTGAAKEPKSTKGAGEK